MPNDEEVIIDPNNETVVETNELQNEEQGEETTQPEVKQEKPTETPEDRASRLLRQTNQARKKLGLEPVGETKVEKQGKKSEDFGYGEKAFLVANGIKISEIDFVKNELKESGKTLDELLENKYFQERLKEKRELDSTTSAMPKNSKRSGQTSPNSVDYWIAKGELPDDVALRRKVVNARIDAEKNKNVFGLK